MIEFLVGKKTTLFPNIFYQWGVGGKDGFMGKWIMNNNKICIFFQK